VDHISALAGQTLEWLQPKTLEHYFELQAGPPSSPHRPSIRLGHPGHRRDRDGTWTFKRVGFLNPR